MNRIVSWLPLGGLVALGFLALAVVPGRSEDQPAKQKQIAEIEEQLKALNKQLNELKQVSNVVVTPTTPAAGSLPAEWVKALTWRAIGPANMGGRIIDLSVYEADPTTYWVATASGGLLKTTNNGVTFEHQFDREATVSIGAVCVAPSDKNVVWVGTGEYSPRNSVSYGDGVYKSTDGGKTWKNMGLKKSFQTGKIVVHPKDPNIVYVGALGRLYGPNEERGLFKTTDGGKTWNKIHYVDDKTGVIDLVMNPKDPETLLVATYERQRDGFDFNDPAKKWGPGSGLYKTTDGGKTFKKLTQGLPTCTLGRIGIDYYRKDPSTVYIILESEKIGGGPPQAAGTGDAFAGFFGESAEDAGARIVRLIDEGAAAKAGLQVGDVVTAIADKPVKGFPDVMEISSDHKPGDKVKVKYTRGGKAAEVELTFGTRPQFGGGGQRGTTDPSRPFAANLGGQRENVQDRQGADGFQYGGVYKSTDGGESWTRINSVNPRPMYFSTIRVDPSDNKYLYVLGVSLYASSDGGKTFRTGTRGVHADQHALWIDPKDGRHQIVGCDGGFYVTYDRMTNWDHLNHLAIGQFYQVAVDTRPLYRVYGGLQDNGTWGGPGRTRGQTAGVNEDWVSVGGGDGFRCAVDPNDPDLVYYESQNGNFGRRNFRTGEGGSIRPRPQQTTTPTPAPKGEGAPPTTERRQVYRFNWNSPFLLSHANSRIYYCAGNYVFRSLDRGNDLQIISPELTRTNQGSASALSESPRNPNVLWAGTDDGYLWVTRDGGAKWENITAKVGLPGSRWVGSVEASRFAEGRAYVVFDAHRSDDDEPYVYVTEDYGQTWKSIRANLPWGSSRVLREDLRNPDLLYVGTEFAVWASINRGGAWTKINNNLPTVAVHDFAQHQTTGDLVAATHGRSVWILDVTPLRQITAEAMKESVRLYLPATATRWRPEPRHGGTSRRFVGQNAPAGAQVYYSITGKVDKANLKIVDYTGKTVRELTVQASPGLHRANWDLTTPAARNAATTEGGGTTDPAARRGTGGRGQAGGAGRGRGGQAGTARPGGAGEATPGETPTGQTETPGEPGRFPLGFGGGGTPVPAGMYRVVLTVDGKEYTQSLRVEVESAAANGSIIADEEDDD